MCSGENASTPSAKEANETWKDVPSLPKTHLTETKEDKTHKGMLGVFIDIWSHPHYLPDQLKAM